MPTSTVERRRRTHEATLAEIKAAARKLMKEQGSSAVGLRAVAREMGITPSALYRYVASREELITTLIVESFDAVGEVVEAAAARVSGGGAQNFLVVAGAFRAWCLEHPEDFALLYGSPIPGYEAPSELTMLPAMRVPAALLSLLAEELTAGRATLPVADADLTPALRAGMKAIARGDDLKFTGFGPAAIASALTTWHGLLGAVSCEVFAQMPVEVAGKAADALFRFAMLRQLSLLGISSVG